MSNTYTQIHIQCIFAVKYRDAVINRSWKERLHKYIIAIVNNNGHRALAINSMSDHLHLFFGLRPKQSLSDLMRLVKGDSSEWINKQKLVLGKFRWQEACLPVGRDMGLFHIQNHKQTQWLNIFLIRKSITEKKFSGKNIRKF